MLEPAVLVSLEAGPAHGYALAEQLEAYGLAQVPRRRVYRLLRDLEELGWVASSWDTEETQGPPRRVYELTDEGERALTGWVQHLKESRAALDRLIRAYEQALGQDDEI
jgi:PadR family transcriptional regulator PadR